MRERDLVDSIMDARRSELPGVDPPGFDFAPRVLRLAEILTDAMSQFLASWGLANADYGVLNALLTAGDPYELRPSDLRPRLLLSSGGISKILNRLEAVGWIERASDPADGRSSRVRLTPAGGELAESAIRAWSDALRDMFRALPTEAAGEASDALRVILLALGDYEPREARRRPLSPPGASRPALAATAVTRRGTRHD